MDKLSLNIAGFNISISFEDNKTEPPGFLAERLKDEILGYCNGFMIGQRVKNIDFSISIITGSNPEIIVDNKYGKISLILLEKKNGNKITVFNHISVFQFQLILRYILHKLLLKNKGFMFHSSAANINSEVNIFWGGSGAGKSTAAKFLSKEYEVLSDDMTLVRKSGSQFYVHQAPFMEKEEWIKRANVRYPLGRFFFLRKADFFKVEKINDKEQILRGIIDQELAQGEELKQQIKFLFEFVSNFNEFYFLYFAKDEEKMVELFKKLE